MNPIINGNVLVICFPKACTIIHCAWSVWPYATTWPCVCNHRTQLSPLMRSIYSPGAGKQSDLLVITRLNNPEWKRGTEEDKLQNERFAYVHGHSYCDQKTSSPQLRTNYIVSKIEKSMPICFAALITNTEWLWNIRFCWMFPNQLWEFLKSTSHELVDKEQEYIVFE